jgi:O-Antigen ligase
MAHAVATALLALWLVWQAHQAGVGVVALLVCGATLGVQALAPRWPVMALAGFVVAAHALPRYGADNKSLLGLSWLNLLAWLALTGWLVWWARSRQRLVFDPLLGVMGLLLAWGALSMAWQPAAWAGGGHSVTHHPAQYLQAAVLMLVASTSLSQRGATVGLTALLCGLPVLRALLQTDGGTYLDGDIAAIAVIALPLALLSAVGGGPWWQRALWMLLAANMLRIVVVAQNRGAAIGLACMLLVLWWNARWRWRWLMAAVPLAGVLALAVPASYVDRFQALWDETARHATATLDRNSAAQRLELWRAGAQIVADHPWLGVGPGNYPKALASYMPSAEGMPTHNNLLNVAAETGLPGALLYVLLFGGALVRLQGLIRRDPGSWRRDAARAVQAAIVAYLGIGLLLSRQDMQLAYLLVGWAAALAWSEDAGRKRVAMNTLPK